MHKTQKFTKHASLCVQQVHSAWWDLAKETDSGRTGTFDDEWNAFIELVQTTATVGEDAVARAVAWLNNTFYAKREQWAARFTWSLTTWGVHSTQRAEAIHSAIKRFLTGSHLLVDLLKELVEYSKKSRDDRDVDMVRRSILNAARVGHEIPVVSSLAEKVTPFAYNLVRAQGALAMQYTTSDHTVNPPPTLTEDMQWVLDASGEELESGGYDEDVDLGLMDGLEDFYLVRHVANTRKGLRYTEAGRIESHEDPADFGLEEIDCSVYHGARHTSVHWCSCQFFKVFLLPCRHMIRVCIQRNLTNYDLCYVGQKWKQLTPAMLDMLRRSLRDKRPPRIEPPDPTRVSALRTAERFSILTEEFRVAAQLGSQSEFTFVYAREELSSLIRSIRSWKVNSVPTDGLQDGTAGRVSAEMKTIQIILGSTLQVAPQPDDGCMYGTGRESLLGHPIAFKFPARSGGWARGTIVGVVDDKDLQSKDASGRAKPDNFEIKYPADRFNEEPTLYTHALNKASYTIAPAGATVYSWFLLENKPLGVDVDTVPVVQPQPAPKPVRRQKRKTAGASAAVLKKTQKPRGSKK